MTIDITLDDVVTDEIIRNAIGWLVELDADEADDGALFGLFERWVNEKPAHRAALRRVERARRLVDALNNCDIAAPQGLKGEILYAYRAGGPIRYGSDRTARTAQGRWHSAHRVRR